MWQLAHPNPLVSAWRGATVQQLGALMETQTEEED